MALLAGALATLALGLAIVGIYGVTTFMTGQRTREIGVRMAVGASRAYGLRLLLRDSLRPVAMGLSAGGGAIGRKLDFLAQEFNRESNTLCSKSNAAAVTAIGLELKAVVDQFREQVQNLE